MKSAHLTTSLATLVVRGKLVSLPRWRMSQLLDALIGEDLSEAEFLRGRSYLCEDSYPSLNILDIEPLPTWADLPAPSG